MPYNKTFKKKYIYNTCETIDSDCFSSQLSAILYNNFPNRDEIIILCIGTDRATGDSLGPIIGYKLKTLKAENVHVYGTLENPIHAKNIVDTIYAIKKNHDNPTIIAIDACLGSINNIGKVTLGQGAISPGAGVKKNLPKVGDIYITGTVNFNGYMDMVILQNTRLNTVMKMADFISIGIVNALKPISENNLAI